MQLSQVTYILLEHMSEAAGCGKRVREVIKYRPDACRPFFERLAHRRVWQTPTLVALSELAVIGTPASAISRDQLAYANKAFLELHAANQSFFVKQPEIVDIMKNLADVAKVVTRDMARPGSVSLRDATQ